VKSFREFRNGVAALLKGDENSVAVPQSSKVVY
jgi:hypothetical protein